MSRFFGGGDNLGVAVAGIFFHLLLLGILCRLLQQHCLGNFCRSISPTSPWKRQLLRYVLHVFHEHLAISDHPINSKAPAWKFYFTLIALNLVAAFIYWMWHPHTNQLTVKEVAGAFGDDIVKAKTINFIVDAKNRDETQCIANSVVEGKAHGSAGVVRTSIGDSNIPSAKYLSSAALSLIISLRLLRINGL